MSSWRCLRYERCEIEDSVKGEHKMAEEDDKQSSSTGAERSCKDFSDSEGESGDDFSGFPVPMALESPDDLGFVRGVFWLGSGSGSESSFSSSVSSDGHARAALDLAVVRENESRVRPVFKGQGQVSMGTKTPSSLLHSPISGDHLDSPTNKIAGGKGECHRLPLPPGSPHRPSMLQIPRSLSLEDTLSKWRKGKFIRRCSSGPLFLGFNCERGKMCTIKEVTAASDDKSSRKYLQQLMQEKTLLSQLSHANIVRYYGFEMRGKTLSVYLEYISGRTILALLEEYGPLGETVLQNYTRQVLSALVYLHGQNTVHRNIRAENLVADLKGDVKLVDFGMAKSATSSSSVPLLEEIVHWMAPEVVMNTSTHSFAADIWSLGCTIIEMATSKPPWSQYGGAAAIYKIGKSKDAPEIPNHLSNHAKSFIRLCLQRDPSARPTAKQLLTHPFVRNQISLKETNTNSTAIVVDTDSITREAFSRAFSGNHIQYAPVLQSSRMSNTPPFRPSKGTHSSVKISSNMSNSPDSSRLTVPRTLIITRDSTRTLTPPSSHVLNDEEQSGKSPLSPPHPSCTFDVLNNEEQSSKSLLSPPRPSCTFDVQNNSIIHERLSSRSSPDTWLNIPQFSTGNPARSPYHRIQKIS